VLKSNEKIKQFAGNVGIEIPEPWNGPLPDQELDEQPIKPWAECLKTGMCSSEELASIDVAPPEPILGDWLREGDLGFIYSQRGIGKTWLALDVAHGIAEKKDVGPWPIYQQLKCFYLDGEMPPGDIKKRDHALGKASKNLVYLITRSSLIEPGEAWTWPIKIFKEPSCLLVYLRGSGFCF
jgi:hypothetical protein